MILRYLALVAFLCVLVIAVAMTNARGGVAHRAAHTSIAVCTVFGNRCLEALKVVDCETGGSFSTRTRNGQYLGLFQMGSAERRRYGHGDSALTQAQAAYRYFVASGHDWSPWSCQP